MKPGQVKQLNVEGLSANVERCNSCSAFKFCSKRKAVAANSSNAVQTGRTKIPFKEMKELVNLFKDHLARKARA